ncbi:calcium-binding protein [Gymnodinialimonas ulvae]|uniref:calcium-binding protein n=1 Tax=Gymnodinialimonas ulvae TaxID=3126504 RepID=UPI0030B651EF
MLVAGSVLALLLAGLTVDGLLHPTLDEDGADTDADNTDQDEHNGEVTSLENFLYPDGDGDAGDQSLQGRAEALGYTPLDDVDALPTGDTGTVDPVAAAAPDDASDPVETASDAAEASGDSDGVSLDGDVDLIPDAGDLGSNFDAAVNAQTLLDVTETITLPNGSEVPLVSDFESETDLLVMEFDGAEGDAPEITVSSNTESPDKIVEANGLPITLVQDAPDFTEKHISVVMNGLEDDFAGMDFDEFEGLIDDVESASDDADPTSDTIDSIPDGLPNAEVLDDLFDTLEDNLSDVGVTSDALDARAMLDPAFGTGGSDAMTGSFNADVLTGDEGQDALFGDEGDDTLSGGGGNDEIHGDFGDDELDGGDGIDFLDGGDGNDALDGGDGDDVVFGGDGDDQIAGGAGDDILQGGTGADTLDGGSGADILNGTFGNHDGADQDAGDLLLGGDGDDSLLLGKGDIATGGAGEDSFTGGDHMGETAGTVTDFNPSEDRIEVIYDPETNPDPLIEVRDFVDGSGADVILDGQVILSVSGAQGLNPNLIELRAST